MDTRAAIFAYVSVSATLTIALLVVVPEFLFRYGFAMAWIWISILSTWLMIEILHADFQDDEFRNPIADLRDRDRQSGN